MMLCRSLKHLLCPIKSPFKQSCNLYNIQSHFYVYRHRWIYNVSAFIGITDDSMSSVNKFRYILKHFSVKRFWGAWTKGYLLTAVVKKCKHERVIHGMVQRFRESIFCSKPTLVFAAAAAYTNPDEESTIGSDKSITDQELESLVSELDNVETLSQNTLFCLTCDKRLVVDRKHPGIIYCGCNLARCSGETHDGWMPFMEAEDVVIWRKEYKSGLGVYAYKVYGKYNEVRAEDFAAIQIDGDYRREWDAAVAALSVVESKANGVDDQEVLYWAVLWPKLFANRDYVYIRRHKDYGVTNRALPHKDRLFSHSTPCATDRPDQEQPITVQYHEENSVHARAKRKSHEADRDNLRVHQEETLKDNKVFIILSRSCEHPSVPETKKAIRVTEYWSHMVIRTLDGVEKPGMEFVLTYYDEPSTGVLPTGVTAWATGRAAPNYLDRMRRAADHYQSWIQAKPPSPTSGGDNKEEDDAVTQEIVMEPTIQESNGVFVKKETTQADSDVKEKVGDTEKKSETIKYKDSNSEESDAEDDANRGWWKYLHPFYYFV